MTPTVVERGRILLVGMDYFGNPTANAAGWSEHNAIGQLWKRFNGFYDANKDSIRHLVSESGYEVWVGVEGVTTAPNASIFVGVEVREIEDLPLALVAKVLPKTRYAVFTLKGEQIKKDWGKIWEWLPQAGHTSSHKYLLEYYDVRRFKGLGNPESELDFMIPVV